MAFAAVRALGDGTALAIKVTPRASRVRIEPQRAHEDRLRVLVTAAPADGEANAAVTKLLAKSLRVPKSSIEITSGASGREKTVLIHGIDPQEIERRLASYFEKR